MGMIDAAHISLHAMPCNLEGGLLLLRGPVYLMSVAHVGC